MPLPRNDLQVTSVDEPIKIVDVRRLVIDVGRKDPPDSVTVEYFGPNLSVGRVANGIGFDPHLTMAMSLRDDARKVARFQEINAHVLPARIQHRNPGLCRTETDAVT